MSLIDRARTLFKRRAAHTPDLTKWTVQHEPLDEYAFERLLHEAPKFSAAMTEKPLMPTADGGQQEFELAPDLWQDAFNVFHNSRLELALTNPAEVLQSHRFIREIMEHFADADDTRSTRAMTRGDRELSGIATMNAREVLKPYLEQQAQESVERSQDMKELQDKLDQLAEQLAEQRAQAAQDANEIWGVQPETAQAVKDLTAQRQEARETLATLDEQQANAQVAAVQAVNDAAADTKELIKAWGELPGTGDGEVAHDLNVDDQFELAQLWRDTPGLRDLAELIGVYKRLMKGARRRNVKHGREERVGVELGNDLRLLVPSEGFLLTRPTLKLEFYRRFVGRQLRVYETIGYHEAGQGDIFVTLDLSGSMNKPVDGQPHPKHVQAKAITLALLPIAHADNRSVHIIGFQDNVIGEWSFPARRPIDLRLLTDFATRAPGGGTNGSNAVRRAEKIVTQSAKAGMRGDIVAIVDGIDRSADPALKARLEEQDIHVHGIAVGVGVTAWMRVMCDDVIAVSSLSEATDHIATVTV